MEISLREYNRTPKTRCTARDMVQIHKATKLKLVNIQPGKGGDKGIEITLVEV